MDCASKIRLQATIVSALFALTTYAKAPTETEVRKRLEDISVVVPRTTQTITVPVLVRQGNASTAQRQFNNIQNRAQNQDVDVPQFNQRTRQQNVTVNDWAGMSGLVQGFQSGLTNGQTREDVVKSLTSAENVFRQRYERLTQGSFPSVIAEATEIDAEGRVISGGPVQHKPGEGPTPGTPGTPDPNADAQAKAVFDQTRIVANSVASGMVSEFSAKAANPPEIEAAKQAAQQAFERQQQQAQAEQQRARNENERRAAQAAAANGGGGKGGGGSGGGGSGGGQGGNGLQPVKIADGGRGIASKFDPKFEPIKEDLSAFASAGNNGGNPSSGLPENLVNPLTASNFPSQPAKEGEPLGDVGKDQKKGLSLGGKKSTPQSLTFGDTGGGIPANNASGGGGGGGGGNPPIAGGGGGMGGGTAGDPYAGLGVEKPYKPVNYNLSKSGGYQDGGGGGGGEGGAGAGPGEETVDGGVADGLDPKTKELVGNVTRPGQFLPSAGEDSSGYPGVFAYRGYLRKLCETPEGRQKVTVCRRDFNYQVAKAPVPSPRPSLADPALFAASAK